MTASERLLSAWDALTAYAASMTPAEAGLNAGFTAAALAVGLFAVYLGRRAIGLAARRFPGQATAEKTVRLSRVARVLMWGWRAVCVMAVLAAVADIWGLHPATWLSTVVGAAAAASVVRLALLILAAAALFELVGYAVGRGMEALAGRSDERRRQAQLRTLGPVLEGAAQTTLVVVTVMMGLSELGVKIGPLLAGAGVVGIAIGFGAQSLVKDFLTGLFLIVEDIVSVGDIVRIGDAGGLVEQMTLRTIRLRDFDGTLHVFPYGEAQVVHNLTKTFSYSVIDLMISYDSSIDDALALMRTVGDGMQADEAFADKIVEPIEVVGVDNLADSGVRLKARIKTRPIEQWSVGREYNRRIKLAFDKAGIEIPFPHMKVVLPEAQISELVRH